MGPRARTISIAAAAGLAILTFAGSSAPAATPRGEAEIVAPAGSLAVTVAYGSQRDEYLMAYVLPGDDRDASAAETFVQRIDAAGTPSGNAVRVATTSFASGSVSGQRITYNPARDEFLLVWEGPTSAAGFEAPREILGLRLTSAAVPIGAAKALVRAKDQQPSRIQLCCRAPAVAYEARSGGYYLAWPAGRDDGQPSMFGRRISGGLGRGTIRHLMPVSGTVQAFAIAPHPSGYVLAASFDGDGADAGLWTTRLSRTGRREGPMNVVYSPVRRGMALARNERTGRFAVAFADGPGLMLVQELDTSGAATGGLRRVKPRREEPDATVETLTYSRGADEYLLGWNGLRVGDTSIESERAALRAITGRGAWPAGGTSPMPEDSFVAASAATTRESLWLVLTAYGYGLTAQLVRPAG